MTLLSDISIGIIFATIAGHIARLLKQPPILGYVAGGMILGANLGLGWVTSAESIELISEIGLILLLFIIGLEINLRELVYMGKAMFTLGIVQFLACVLIGWAFFHAAGYTNANGNFDLLYISVALALSSTLIVVKLLHDKFEVSTTAGQLTVGVLVLQDIWAIVFMAFQPSLLNPQFGGILRSLALGLVIVVAAFGTSRYLLPKIFSSAGKSPELVLLTAVAWCFSICALAEYAGLSKEMGALIAGMSIAAFPYGADVISKMAGVRDFFVTLFFVSLGLKMPEPTWRLVGASAIAVGVVIFSRLLSVVPTAMLLRRGLRIGAVTALNLSQISEFSLVILALGAGLKHVSQELQTTVLAAMLLASVVSTYLIMFNHALARGLVRMLSVLGIRDARETEEEAKEEEEEARRDIVLLGCFRSGMALLERMAAEAPGLKPRVMVVDFNPGVRPAIEPLGYKWVYGDIAHPETLRHLNIGHASVIICSLSDTFLKGTTNTRLLRQLKNLAPRAACIMTAEDKDTASELAGLGAAHVMIPGELAGAHLLDAVRNAVSRAPH